MPFEIVILAIITLKEKKYVKYIKTIKNHNEIISLAIGEELLNIPFTDREKGLIRNIRLKPYPVNAKH